MTNIIIPKDVTLQNLIEKNIQSLPAPILVNKPFVEELKLSDGEKQEILEAAEFIQKREAKAKGNRFAAKDNLNDPTLNETRKIVSDFIEIAQEAYLVSIAKVEQSFAETDKLKNDLNGLLHSKKVISAIEALKKATQPIVERIDAVDNTYLGDSYEDDITSYFAMTAIRRLHREG